MRWRVCTCIRWRRVLASPFTQPPPPPPSLQCNALEGMHVHQVAAGAGFSLFLASPDNKERLDKLPVFESTAPEEAAGGEEEAGGGEVGGLGEK